MEKKYIEIELINGSIATILDTDEVKLLKSEGYNFFFNKKSGLFIRWGTEKDTSKVKTKISLSEHQLYKNWCSLWDEVFDINQFVVDLETDGDLSLGLPEILDIEVSTKCDYGCSFCYKSNNNGGSYMTTADFTTVIDKMPQSLTQIALGIGNVTQPNLFELMDVCIDRDIVPNVTINGAKMTTEIFDKLEERVGAIAISYYNENLCFNSIYELATVRGMKQINIHAFLSEETYDKCMQLIDNLQTDVRAKDLNALVFLSNKTKGNSKINGFHNLSQEKYNFITKKALDSGINIGMDSCSSQKTLISYKDEPAFERIKKSIEPCESSIYSCYINKDGQYYPCSFSEGEKGHFGDWTSGLDVLGCNDFVIDIWNNQKTRKFSTEVEKCRACNKSCTIFDI